MLSELNNPTKRLADSASDDPRGGALRLAIDWSHKALSPRAREVFNSLSIFRGGFTVEAIHAITGARNAVDIANEIAMLSLIASVPSGKVMRLSMLDSLARIIHEIYNRSFRPSSAPCL
jgi:predicted ATPase